ncbi:unnamed protein product [Mycena citricolor]|uniref:Uncharacterized protein n=1 Tax=Mycena citricolor TaxID=2018698 RepID=A0AAD2GUT2_9AGAR|nr:unnamed protein product [Mycena citricolor]
MGLDHRSSYPCKTVLHKTQRTHTSECSSSIFTRERPRMPRYAMPEGLFADLHIQPHVHDLSVLITRRSIQTKFRVYFRRHCRLPRNATRQGIRGEVLFMRAGKQCKDAVVGLRAGDPLLITSILKQCVRSFLRCLSVEPLL